MKKFGLGDHRFDPNFAVHLSSAGCRICGDLTYTNSKRGQLCTISEDYADSGINGCSEGNLNNYITSFTNKNGRNRENDDVDVWALLEESLEQDWEEYV